MLAGRRPFGRDTPAATLHAIGTTAPPPLAAVRSDVPDAVQALIHALLEREPSRRPASAADVVDALASLASLVSLASDGVAAPVAGARRAVSAALGPMEATPLVGREGELASALGLLGHTRLLTLTGPGGTGKTRLALELARRASAWFGGRSLVVRLAGVTEPARVPEVIAREVGLRDPVGTGDAVAIARHLGEEAMLLVLDNFEHLLEAVGFVAALLAAAPRLTLVVTSREPLRLRAEQELPVPPLALPSTRTPADIAASDAVRLFVQRARAARPDFVLDAETAEDVAELCRRLDGLPLAIELAAARTRFFSPRALRARLDRRLDLLRSDARDADPRHRALRDVMAWSFDLLSEDEQALFVALGVFAGSFTLDAAAAVAAPGVVPDEVLDRVCSLCDKSLLTRRDAVDGEPRLVMLETVREFARERLAARGDEGATRHRHARWYATMADRIGDETGGPARAQPLARVQADFDDVLAALAWSTGGEGDARDALQIVGGLTMFWHWSGLWRDGRAWADRALAAADRVRETRDDATGAAAERDARGRTLQAAHLLTWTLGDPEAALAYAERARRVWDALEAAPGPTPTRTRAAHWATYTHCVAAFSHLALGDTAAARAATDAGVAAAGRAGGAWILGFAHGWRAMLRTTLGAQAPAVAELASADLANAERLLGSVGDAWTLAWCYTQAAVAALAADDPLAAARNAATAVALMRDAPDWPAVARAFEVLAAAAVRWLDGLDAATPDRARAAHEAAALLGAAAASRERGGMIGWASDRQEAEATARRLRAELGESAFVAAAGRGHGDGADVALERVAAMSRAARAWPLTSWTDPR